MYSSTARRAASAFSPGMSASVIALLTAASMSSCVNSMP